MKKFTALTLAAAMVVGTFTGCGSDATAGSDSTVTDGGEERVLNIFTWEGYYPPEVLDGFTAQTGIKINYSPFQTNEEMLTKLQATGGGDYDIVIASDYIIETARQEGNLMMELDKSLIPNYSNLNEAYLNQYYDPESLYTVPHAPGSPVIVYDPTKVTQIEINSYKDLWHPFLVNTVGMMDDPRVITGITLKSLGYSMNEEDSGKLAAAGEKLVELAPNIRMLDSNNLQIPLLSGEISIALMFTSSAAMAVMENPYLEVVYPEEGMGFGIDSIFVPSNAPHPNNAHAFIDYILDPEVAATVSSWIMYQCPNEAAAEYLPEYYTTNPAVFIPDSEIGITEFIKPIGIEAMEQHDKIWTTFKQALS